MFKKLGTSLLLAFAYHVSTAATAADSAVLITSASTIVEFDWNSKNSKVEVKQKKQVTYFAEGYDCHIPVTEFYNDNEKIEHVAYTLNGRVPLGFKPEHSYYSQDNIFYSDARICYFPLHLKEKGNKATTTIVKTINDPRYFCSVYFSEPYRIQSKEIVVKIPRWMKAEIKEMNFDKGSITKTVAYDKRADADVITYHAANLPAQKHESNSPGPSYIYPHLLILSKSASYDGVTHTYFNTLADQYGWYNNLLKDLENNADVIKAKANEITAGLTDDLQKAKAVFYWVQNNIRYIAFEDGIAGFKPDKADEVLRKKYGDCKGMANLTKNLLIALGYDARLCWIGTNHIAYTYDTPSMAVDNHMICALNLKSKTYYLDATETFLPFNEYAERIQGRQVLVEDGEKYILSKIPSTTVSQNLDHEKKTMNINAALLAGTVNRVYRGEEKEYMLSKLNSFKKTDYEKALVKYLTNDEDNTIQKLDISNLENYDKDLKINYQIDQKSGMNTFGKDLYIELDLKKELGSYDIDTVERSHDYWLPYKFNIQRETELILPENLSVSSLPPNLSISNADYDFNISYKAEADKVIYKKTLLIKNPRISKSKFSRWNADIKKLNTAYSETLVLKPKS